MFLLIYSSGQKKTNLVIYVGYSVTQNLKDTIKRKALYTNDEQMQFSILNIKLFVMH